MHPLDPPGMLDETARGKICALIAMGCSRRTAAAFVGTSLSAIRRTAARDRGFLRQLRQAESQHEIAAVRIIERAAVEDHNWRAAAWTLERRYPDRFARRQPFLLTLSQLRQVLDHFMETLLAEVRGAAARRRIRRRLLAMRRGIPRLVERKPP